MLPTLFPPSMMEGVSSGKYSLLSVRGPKVATIGHWALRRRWKAEEHLPEFGKHTIMLPLSTKASYFPPRTPPILFCFFLLRVYVLFLAVAVAVVVAVVAAAVVAVAGVVVVVGAGGMMNISLKCVLQHMEATPVYKYPGIRWLGFGIWETQLGAKSQMHRGNPQVSHRIGPAHGRRSLSCVPHGAFGFGQQKVWGFLLNSPLLEGPFIFSPENAVQVLVPVVRPREAFSGDLDMFLGKCSSGRPASSVKRACALGTLLGLF